MQFTLIDRIVQLEENRQITAVKALSLAEEYLQDHFPRFPVMPGVLMLEALFQSSAWLLLKSDDFARPFVTLEETRNIKYADFVTPGELLTVTATLVKQDDDGRTTLRAQGSMGGSVAVGGRLIVRQSRLADQDPNQAAIDSRMQTTLRRRFELLYRPEPTTIQAAT